jgi:uncharacterized protein (TIGR03083 family)
MPTAESPSLETILDALGETLESFKGLLSELSPEDWHRPTGCPGWDVQDVVSHIVGGEAGFAALSGAGRRADHGSQTDDGTASSGTASSGPAPRGDTNRTIAEDVQSRRGDTPAELMAEFAEVTAASMERRRASDRRADEITEGPFGWKLPYDRLLSIRTFDCVAHEQDVRRAVGRPGNLDGKAAALVEDFIFEVLDGAMRKRVPALEDHRVRIQLTDRAGTLVLGGRDKKAGPAAGTDGGAGKGIEAGDNGAGDNGAGERPETTIRMPFGELIALACGRVDVSHGLVSVEGDEELAREVLSRIGFTP